MENWRSKTFELGSERLRAEDQRVADLKAAAMPPASCGPAIQPAPARGAFWVFQPVELMPKGVDGWEAHPAGYRGRDALAAADVFDAMMESARRRGDKVPPLTPGQIAIGRHYRNLVERHDSGGIKLSSLEAGRSGSGGGARDIMDVRLSEARELDTLRKRIGAGVAMEVRRVRPSKRGGAARGIIMDRALVDAVCLGGLTFSEVLRSYGWACKGEHRDSLRGALSAALDRMQGNLR
ncbi:hypothetical protein [Paenirhodobacter sp. CAU 1674]|uniref:hypothetical protein n=1 Tax=Paenirhodobacter sp. CAU 1674 TaxID=3032596 RepID=UPI0023DAD933|nr:hypothetical protein [Paenirhodobacter sp. CAU 1674]MDF2140847.1 hypothetical protein [Paenirhodobacter sp. CAU 1674]